MTETVVAAPNPRRWLTLAVVGAAFFMTVLDVAIVNVAIPSIQLKLHTTPATVQWVLIAYSITFGGFLLLGGRMADLLGRRLIFLVGLTLFTLASLICGLAGSIGVLIAARAVQGVGAAIISPAALSIVSTTFEEGADRNKALGIWGALGGSGAAAGVLFGGILTKYLGWEWIFFVNVPVGALVFALTPIFVPESRADMPDRRFDAAGAVTVTGGLALLVYAISKAPDVGWGSARTILLLIASAVILAAFVLIELRGRAPLMPFSIFRIRSLLGANVVGFLLGSVIFADFFVLTFYVQETLHWSALKTGVTFLATAGTTVIWAGVAQALTTRFGPRPVIVAGLLVLAASMVQYTQIPLHGHYWPDLLPAYLAFALGLAFAFVPVTIAALAQVAPREAGLASGLINTSQQIGGAIGIAIATTIFRTKAKDLGFTPAGFVSGYQDAFWALIALALIGAVAAFILLRGVRREDVVEQEPAEVAV
ncbi:MAG TPA: MFS transporter [Gaiellaceae bacterium]|nr:MFS transporter [Gaiellaceae bacterium]